MNDDVDIGISMVRSRVVETERGDLDRIRELARKNRARIACQMRPRQEGKSFIASFFRGVMDIRRMW